MPNNSNCRSIRICLIVVAMAPYSLVAQLAADLMPTKGVAPVRIEVNPKRFELSGTREKLRLIVTGVNKNGEIQDLTRIAHFSTSNGKVAFVEKGVVQPRSDGTATITVQVGRQSATSEIVVSGQMEFQPVSFHHDALPALSKQGCNAGACHGSPSGKGGFRLSLRAFDAKLDEYTLLNEEYGRRVNPLDSEKSLLLQKPLMKITHGGGMQMRTTDPAYHVLRDWISEGCKLDSTDAPHCVGIEILPGAQRVLRTPAHQQQLSVLARFSDGSVRDVTELAVYSSSDNAIATVDGNGLVVGNDRGEVAILVRYLEFIESTFITFVKDIDGFEWTNPPTNNYIDTLVHAKLKQLQFLPSDICTDEEFLRRVFLDLLGSLPTLNEVEDFLSADAKDKREQLIDRLVERREFAQFWALKWGDLLKMTRGQVGDEGIHKYHRWLTRAIDANMPYDDFARALLTASGSTFDNPPANFYRTTIDTNDRVETISQIFLGARLQCAKCHNHPFERWTQDNYYGMGAFFHRVQKKKTRRNGELFVWASAKGDVTQPRTGKKMRPWAPVIGVMENVDPLDQRKTFADWLTSKENPFFARIEVNRIWAHLLGRGIVDPPDDFRDSNPASIGSLLDALAQDFVDHDYDRKHILRTILKSRTYQMSHLPNDFNRDDTKYFSHYQPRLLGAEQLLDAICSVTGIDEKFDKLPPHTKATQIPAPDLVSHEFLKVFGKPERQTVCQCERSTESNLAMAIEFLNGSLIYNKLRNKNNRFRRMIESGNTDEEIITAMNRIALSRSPSDAEMKTGLAHIATKTNELSHANISIEDQLRTIEESIAKIREATRKKLESAKIESLPAGIRDDTKRALISPAEQRSEIEKYLVGKLGPTLQVREEEIDKALNEMNKQEWEALQESMAELKKQLKSMEEIRIIALEDICWVILNRNEFLFNH